MSHVIVTLWGLMGFQLAFKQAQIGSSVKWIGPMFHIHADSVEVTIDAYKLNEVYDKVQVLMNTNVVAIKVVRSFVGVCSHIASILYVWRPLLGDLWVHFFCELGFFRCTA